MIEEAKQSLEKPEYFAYYGDLYEEDGWGRAFGQHRDSDALERSNWQVISTDLKERFPDDIVEESASHWAVGWVETLRVKVLIDPEKGIEEDNITDAFKAVIEWKDALADYPVADEMHWCELEHDEMVEYLDDEIPLIWSREHDDDMPEYLAEAVMRKVFEHHSTPDDIPYKELEEMVEETWIEGLIADATAINENQLEMELKDES